MTHSPLSKTASLPAARGGSVLGETLEGLAGLYGMVDLEPHEIDRAGPLAEALLDGGARILQLRMKHGSARDMLRACERLLPLCAGRAAFIVNDRVDVALAAFADGVHLGQDDLALSAARALSPHGFLIGVSTHNEAQALAAVEAGADYIALGPIFPTTSKTNPDPVVGLERLAAVCRATSVPVVAIGGISIADAARVADAGARAAAIISAVNHAGDVRAAARAVAQAFRPRS